ncbi:hypothetical protein H6P81_018115 [Aristolochia fimbriata]|uniref:Uncharacterized protein n=1 Tax=Aristolochia fimbriata TaxID=158543 RepID=A0AAV7E393_ARIFI|nr:hypothetical protein H6P81_018115 [Aristolochia fimbriata]
MVAQSNYAILCGFVAWLLKEYPKVHLSCQCVYVVIIDCIELKEYSKLKEYPKVHLSCQCVYVVIIACIELKEYSKLKEYPKVNLSCQYVCVVIIACFELEEYPKRILKYFDFKSDHPKVEFLELSMSVSTLTFVEIVG